MTLFRGLMFGNMPTYRKIFPSYDWDEDVWCVNQIVNLPNVLGKENMHFEKAVPNEEVKRNSTAIQQWIDFYLERCSCLVLFVGEKTHLSRWVKYEIEQANIRGMGRLIIYLDGMKKNDGTYTGLGHDPFSYHGLYAPSGCGYYVRQYSWVYDEGIYNIGEWIEDACQRAGK